MIDGLSVCFKLFPKADLYLSDWNIWRYEMLFFTIKKRKAVLKTTLRFNISREASYRSQQRVYRSAVRR